MNKLILVVDDELDPQFPLWRHVRSAEEAFEILDSRFVDELWLRRDLQSEHGPSLIELLLGEGPWEGSKVGLLIVPVNNLDDPPTEVEQRLAGHCKIERRVITPELFRS